MDPLSLAGGILAVLELTGRVVTATYAYVSTVRDAPHECRELLMQMNGLSSTLLAMQAVSPSFRLDGSSKESLADEPPKALVLQLEAPLRACERLLQKILKSVNEVVQPAPGLKGQMKKLAWPLKKQQTKDYLDQIEGFKSTFSLAIAVENTVTAQKSWDTVQHMKHQLENTAASQRESQHAEKCARIHDWLSPVDPRPRHASASERYTVGTGEWFLQSKEFGAWRNSRKSFLWVEGLPGAGKTILSSTVINALWEEINDGRLHKTCLAYFYCEFDEAASQSSINVLGSVVSQLAQQSPVVFKLAESLYDKATPPGSSGGTRMADLEHLLLESSTRLPRLMIIIDALDECVDRHLLLECITRLNASTPANLNVLVTSRKEQDIFNRLSNLPRVALGEANGLKRDVSLYVEKRLQENENLRRRTEDVKKQILSALTQGAQGMFRWVQCQLDHIATLKTDRSILKALHKLPKGLYETYERILLRVANEDEDVVNLLQGILELLVFSFRPLTLMEVWEAIAIEPETRKIDPQNRLPAPEDVAQIAGTLATLTSDGHLTLAHMSVMEFLVSDWIRHSAVSRFALDRVRSNRNLALKCITYLSFDAFAGGPTKDWASFQERRAHVFLDHAARGWPHYFGEAGQDDELLETAMRALFVPSAQDRLLSWVQALHSQLRRGGFDRYFGSEIYATPLYYASTFGLDRIVARLLREGRVDINAPGSRFKGTPLHAAVLRNQLSVAKRLLNAGADPNRADVKGISPMHTAVGWGNIPMIHLLFEGGATPALSKDLNGHTPRDWAGMYGELEAAAVLDMYEASGTRKET